MWREARRPIIFSIVGVWGKRWYVCVCVWGVAMCSSIFHVVHVWTHHCSSPYAGWVAPCPPPPFPHAPPYRSRPPPFPDWSFHISCLVVLIYVPAASPVMPISSCLPCFLSLTVSVQLLPLRETNTLYLALWRQEDNTLQNCVPNCENTCL